MKRILREFFRTRQEKFPPQQDVLIIPKARAEQLTLDQIAEELGKALSFAKDVS